MDLRSGGKRSSSKDSQGGDSSDGSEGSGAPEPIPNEGESLVGNEAGDNYIEAQGTSFHHERIVDLKAQIESIYESFRLVKMGNADTGSVQGEHGGTSNRELRQKRRVF